MYRFVICELVTGKVLDELPMVITSDLTRSLQAYGEGTLALPLFDGGGGLVSATWEESILPWRSLIVVVDESNRIVWHGIPTSRSRSTEYRAVYPCRTVEAYLIRRYVPTLGYVGSDQTSVIFRDLAAVAGAAIGMEYDTPASGVIRDRDYADDENARVYDRCNELAAVEGGFNWTIDVVWGDTDHTFVRKIARTGYPYLGNRDPNPAHTFELGQNITGFDFTESWGEGDGATHVRAVGDGEGDSRLMAAPVVDAVREAAGWPRLEERRSFSGVTVQSTIDAHARMVANVLFGGQDVLTLTARNPGPGEDFTRLRDLTLGDTARVILDTPQLTLDEVWPVVGWSLTPETGIYKPVLARIGEPDGR